MCDLETLRFWIMFFTFSSLFLGATILAWTRHGETEEEQLRKVLHPSPAYIRNYETVMVSDPINQVEKQVLRQMIENGLPMTRINASWHGIKRAQWNSLRGRLVRLGYAEFRADGDLILRDGVFAYLGARRPGGL
jgi:hypothetical protein